MGACLILFLSNTDSVLYSSALYLPKKGKNKYFYGKEKSFHFSIF